MNRKIIIAGVTALLLSGTLTGCETTRNEQMGILGGAVVGGVAGGALSGSAGGAVAGAAIGGVAGYALTNNHRYH